mgnify:CR=1 FL=1
MNYLITYALVPFLVFIPGPVMLYGLSRLWRDINMSLLETVVVGAALWSLFLVLVGFAFGLFLGIAHIALIITTIGGAVLSSSMLLLSIKGSSRFTLPSRTYLRSILTRSITPANLYLVLLVSALITFAVIHPLYYEWDAVTTYLVEARSIAETGTLYNHYRCYGPEFFSCPGLSLLYAISFLFSPCPPRALSISFLILSILAIFVLSRHITRNLAVAASLTFISFPVVIRYMAINCLYADMPALFYLITGIFLLIRAHEAEDSFSLAMSSFILASSALFKPINLIFFPLTLAVAFLMIDVRYLNRLVFVLTSVSAPLAIWVQDFLFYKRDVTFFMLKLPRIIPLTVVAVLLGILSVYHRSTRRGSRRIIQDFLIIALSALPAIALLTACFFTYGGVLSMVPGYGFVLSLAGLRGRAVELYSLGFLGTLRWHPLLLCIASGAPFFVPLVFGSISMIKRAREDKACFLILTWLLLSLLLWAFFFYNSFEQNDYRRLLYPFAPILAALVAEGLDDLSRRYNVSPPTMLTLFSTFLAISQLYVWFIALGSPIQSLTSIGANISILARGEDLVVFMGLFTFFLLLPKLLILIFC